MKNARAIRWLLAEIPGLVECGVVPEAVAGKLRKHYGAVADERRNVALLVTGIIGSVLIGAGIILLLAHNWTGMARWLRTVLAIAPLALVQAIGAWGIWKGKTSTAWRESIGVMIFLLIASSIALVGQTYHIAGDLESFLLVWMLLALPLVYVLDITLVCLCYLVGITFWAGYAQEMGRQALCFWGLLGLAVPHMMMVHRRDSDSPRASLVGWMLAACLSVAIGVTMEKCLPGLWIIVYAGLFAVFYLAGAYWYRGMPGIFRNPLQTVGACGTAGLVLLLSFEWPWDEIGWHYYRYGHRFHQWAAVPEYIAAAVLPLMAIVMVVTAVRRRRAWEIAFGVAPMVATIGYCLVSLIGEALPALLLFNAYAFCLGVASVVIGIRRDRLTAVNGGIAILAVLIVSRFFDVELSFVSRGITFIVIGAVFLGTNILMARRKRLGRQKGEVR